MYESRAGKTRRMREMEIQDDEQNENKARAGAKVSTSGLVKTSPLVETSAPALTLFSFCSKCMNGTFGIANCF